MRSKPFPDHVIRAHPKHVCAWRWSDQSSIRSGQLDLGKDEMKYIRVYEYLCWRQSISSFTLPCIWLTPTPLFNLYRFAWLQFLIESLYCESTQHPNFHFNLPLHCLLSIYHREFIIDSSKTGRILPRFRIWGCMSPCRKLGGPSAVHFWILVAIYVTNPPETSNSTFLEHHYKRLQVSK